MSRNQGMSNLFRGSFLFGSPPRGSGYTDRHSGGRAYRQEAALVFEDLVPDLMWANIEGTEATAQRSQTDNLFPSAFFRWAEETAVLDGHSMHDLILLLQPRMLVQVKEILKAEIEKRKLIRQERKKKEGEKKDKKKETNAQLNLVVESSAPPVISNPVIPVSVSAPSLHVAGTLTPGTPTNTPNTTTGNTPTNTNTHTPATSEPNTRPDSPIGPHAQQNHDDQLQAVSEELDQHQQENAEEITAGMEQSTGEQMSVEVAETYTEGDAMSSMNDSNQITEQASMVPAVDVVSPSNAENTAENAIQTASEPSTVSAPTNPASSPWNDIDPTILASLPDDIRSEVIRDRANQVTALSSSVGAPPVGTVPTEFLDALPDNIRSEIEGAHERAQVEVRRRQVQQQSQAAAAESVPNDDDPASFIQGLDPRLRQQILSEMDTESISRLPTELASEARTLQQRNRTALEQRQMRFLEQRTHRMSRRPNFTSGRPSMMNRPASRFVRDLQTRYGNKRTFPPLPPKHLIDSDSLSCLMVLLFINDSNIQHQKLHRVLKNIFIHKEGRKWITNTLLQIVQRTHESSLSNKDSVQPQVKYVVQ